MEEDDTLQMVLCQEHVLNEPWGFCNGGLLFWQRTPLQRLWHNSTLGQLVRPKIHITAKGLAESKKSTLCDFSRKINAGVTLITRLTRWSGSNGRVSSGAQLAACSVFWHVFTFTTFSMISSGCLRHDPKQTWIKWTNYKSISKAIAKIYQTQKLGYLCFHGNTSSSWPNSESKTTPLKDKNCSKGLITFTTFAQCFSVESGNHLRSTEC